MNVTFIKHTQDNVDDDDGRKNQEGFAFQGGTELGGAAGESCDHGFWKSDYFFRGLDGFDSLSERCARMQIERQRYGGELALVSNGQRRCARLYGGKGVEGDGLASRGSYVNLAQRLGRQLELRFRFEDDAILA